MLQLNAGANHATTVDTTSPHFERWRLDRLGGRSLKASGALFASSPRVGRGTVSQVEPQERATSAGEKGTERRKVLIRLVRKADVQPISGATVVLTSYRYDLADGYRFENVQDDELERFTDENGVA
jgi:hypothetical protein